MTTPPSTPPPPSRATTLYTYYGFFVVAHGLDDPVIRLNVVFNSPQRRIDKTLEETDDMIEQFRQEAITLVSEKLTVPRNEVDALFLFDRKITRASTFHVVINSNHIKKTHKARATKNFPFYHIKTEHKDY